MKCDHRSASIYSACPSCGELVVPDKVPNYFELLGARPRYFLDQHSYQSRFYELSRTLHPDRFHNKSLGSLTMATDWFAELNRALATLKSETSRAEYLFGLARYTPAGGGRGSLPPDLAEEYFTLQETLEEGSPETRKTEFEKFAGLIRAKLDESSKRRDEAFRQWEQAGAPLDEKAFPYFDKAAHELRQRSYLTSMLDDLEKKCLK